MLVSEIRELSVEDIETRIRDLEEERFRLKFRSATEPLEDPLRLRVHSQGHRATEDGATGNARHTSARTSAAAR